MTNRKNLKITANTYELLRAKKREMETWDSLLRRLADDHRVGERRQLVRSWVSRFLESKVTVDNNAITPKEELYRAFQSYMYVMDDTANIPKNEFGRAVQSIEGYPIVGKQKRLEGERVQVYTNVRLTKNE